jgi:hypothetical protein
MKKNLRHWLFALLLSLPMVVFFIAHFTNYDAGLKATGFIQYDNVSYIANAKQYIDGDYSGIFYSNALGSSADAPHIYFQPQNFILVLLLKAGIPPGTALCLFVWFFAVACFRMVIAIADHLLQKKHHRTTIIVLMAWGGGLLAVAGMFIAPFLQIKDLDYADKVFYLDYGWGWWGFNLGRSLFFSMESYYHAVFLGAVYCILKQQWRNTLLLAFLLSVSHPFTGVEFLLIVCGWLFIEKIICKNHQIPWLFTGGMIVLLALHIGYYMFYLNRFEEHRSVSEQYALDWHYRFFTFIPAYVIVALLSWLTLRVQGGVSKALQQPHNRLFISWAVIAFLLANHHWFIKPMQPIHFTRGYIWLALFLLGLPGLQYLLNKIKERRFAKWVLPGFILLFLFDNFAWITNYSRFTVKTASITHISPAQEKILAIIREQADKHTLVIGSDEVIPYLSTVYAAAKPWISHQFTTPFYNRQLGAYTDFINKGLMPAAWNKRHLLLVFDLKKEAELSRTKALPPGMHTLYEDGRYLLTEMGK